ncbi:hypothetical protein J4221_01005 [Candidatus Pacearchaeota archaeon]|nr:hypothetical protein [Candidatus Pacearchaeota archaeon]
MKEIKEKIEDNQKNEDKEEVNEAIKKKQNSQMRFALFLMVAIIIIIVGVPYINNTFLNNFEYKGLEFQKTKLGDLVFYSSRFPVVTPTGKVIGNYAVNFRNDPRKLEDIKVNVSNNTIKFAVEGNKFSPVYISLNPYMEICEDSVISMAGLSKFLGDSGLQVSSAYTDKPFATKNNATYRWCDSSFFDTVIVVTDGNESSITEIMPNCYKLTFNDCRILEVSEKFQLSILEEYAFRFKNKENFEK